LKKLLVANRGEIALRILRAGRDLGIATVAVHSRDDAESPHLASADERVELNGEGPSAYLDIAAILAAGARTGCDAVHPGYGFLSEREDFARACAEADIRFVGPTAEQLGLFGDKAKALELARRCDVPVMPATGGDASLEEIEAFFDAQPAGAGIVIKAVGGGGGRGIRVVTDRHALPEAYARCRSEARSAFGIDAVYGERLISRARHIEVQIAGDGRNVIALGERDCSLQRRFQKLVEIAPSPVLTPALREQIVRCALRMASKVGYRSLGTFEFLVDEGRRAKVAGSGSSASADEDANTGRLARRETSPFVFIEANPRLQVEHTVTEEVTGLDLVAIQLALADGRSLGELGLDSKRPPRQPGFAIQFRINAETFDEQGVARPASGRIERLDLPAGPGVRVDTHARAGYAPSPNFDTLLAKLVVSTRSDDFADAARRAQRALAELRIEGLATNTALLRALVERDDFVTQAVHTRYFEEVAGELRPRAREIEAQLALESGSAAPGRRRARRGKTRPVSDRQRYTAPRRSPKAIRRSVRPWRGGSPK
jgi:acetyl/propionyl-CoA carboxylase alpha subunit